MVEKVLGLNQTENRENRENKKNPLSNVVLLQI